MQSIANTRCESHSAAGSRHDPGSIAAYLAHAGTPNHPADQLHFPSGRMVSAKARAFAEFVERILRAPVSPAQDPSH
jgi:hypothetical protein